MRTSNTCINITSNIYKYIHDFVVRPGGKPLGGGKSCIYFVYIYIKCNTHAYIKCNIDAYIRCPYTHAYTRRLAADAAAGNNGDCTVVLGITITTTLLAALLYLNAVINNGA